MNSGIRAFALAAGTAALLSAQAVYAAPASPSLPGIDPLVSLSILGSNQSRMALASTVGAVQGVPATQTCADGTVIPANAMCSGPVVAHPGIGALPLVLGLVGVIGVIALVATSGNGNGHGDLTPISPA